MRSKWWSLLLLPFYAVPYAYVAILRDYNHRDMYGYLLAVVCLCVLAAFQRSFAVLLAGNLLSLYLSHSFAAAHAFEHEEFFKPFRAAGVTIFDTFLYQFPQLLVFGIKQFLQKKRLPF